MGILSRRDIIMPGCFPECAPLYIAGIGPGSGALLTPRARQALECSECIAGYGLCLDLLPDWLKAGKTVIASGRHQEEERCRQAIQSALAGQATTLVCEGDPGIYSLASITLEILEKGNLLDVVPLAIIPGVPALCATAALLGAPIGHDFACISLSDILTPWPLIEMRLHNALRADFVCVLHNPKSRGRPHYLDLALSIARNYRSDDCPVGFVRNAARKEEKVVITTLAGFASLEVDMLSIIIIGNHETRIAGKYMLTPRSYAHKKP